MKKILPYIFIVLVVFVFFWQFFIKGLIPAPADTIVGLYHPFRDLYAKNYPNGVPFKNFLITDPVRQQYPWRELVISAEKNLELPLWNPYSFAGAPLMANFQSASFYPLNLLLLSAHNNYSWSFIIFLGPLLSGIFLYLYLNNLKLNKWASLLGAITFSFSGFFISWLEWGTITHVVLWLPLILLSVDKIIAKTSRKPAWSILYLFCMIASFFAGHLQIFFYLALFSFSYFIARWWQFGKKINNLSLYIILNLLFLVLSSVQWFPAFQFILLSARSVDIADFNNPGWFIPWQHLIQFIAPDYFGNPATLNYWGAWNYGELVGYVGILPLLLALFAMFYRRDKKTLFFGTAFFLSIIFALPTYFAKLPFLLKIPFISTSQPTRLLFIMDFSLAVLSGFGFDYLLKTKRKIVVFFPLIFISLILICLWIFIPQEHLQVVRSNLLFPSVILICSWILTIALITSFRIKKFTTIIRAIVVVFILSDLFRFGWKFTPFTQNSYFFPSTKALNFLQQNSGEFRIMTTDSRILPPNFSAIYRLQSVDGYDPLYLLRYVELMAASERGRADISAPFGFNRIITPHNYDSRIMDLMGVKYILSLSEISSPKLAKVFQEGQTIIYRNKNVMPRAFFVNETKIFENKSEAIKMLFDSTINLAKTGIVEGSDINLQSRWAAGSANISQYSGNKIIINTENTGVGFLVLTDTFYPIWKATVDGNSTRIYITDYNFRGIVVSAGKHRVEFYNSLF